MSGHASEAFAWATVIGRHYGPKGGIPAYTVATFIAASRMAKNAHWLSDVVAGSALGFGIGRAVVRRNSRPPTPPDGPTPLQLDKPPAWSWDLTSDPRPTASVSSSGCGSDLSSNRVSRLGARFEGRYVRGKKSEAMDDNDAEVREAGELPDAGEDDDAPMPAPGLGAIGQLAVGVLVVVLLIAAFIGASAALRRIFG